MKSQISVSLLPRDSEGNKVVGGQPLIWGIKAGSQMGGWLVDDIGREITREVPRPRKGDVIDQFFDGAND